MTIDMTRKQKRGQVTLEFALIFPILILAILGGIAWGQYFSYKVRLDCAARDGARRGIVGGTKAQIESVVRNRANVPGVSNTTCGSEPCLIVAVLPDDNGGARTVGGDLVVTVRYDAYINVPLFGLFTNPRTIYSRSAMRIDTVP
jgi:Flp pilus assembly protein TadG